MPLVAALQLTVALGSFEFGTFFGSGLLLSAFKFFLVVGSILYAIFGFIVVRQVAIMRNTLITEFSPLFTTLALAHFGFSLFVIFLFVTTL